MNASARLPNKPGLDAIARKGWLAAHKWLLLRRLSQLGILALFTAPLIFQWITGQSGGEPIPADFTMAGQFGEKTVPADLMKDWIIKGNLSSSLVLDVLPLTDPYLLLQMLATGFLPASTAIVGAIIVAVFYLLLGGRVFCSWVCPVNMITDTAAWGRRHFNIKANHPPHANTRYWFLAGTFIASALTGVLAWEWVNPVSIAHRGLFFTMGAGLWFLFAVFLFDLFVASRGWCGHLCPMGAFYSLLGKTALARVAAPGRKDCDDCMDCFAVCPEPHVIRPALKQAGQDSPVIYDSRCTTCGRCIDVCGKQVFRLTHRFDKRSSS